jgi:hypothetical protein
LFACQHPAAHCKSIRLTGKRLISSAFERTFPSTRTAGIDLGNISRFVRDICLGIDIDLGIDMCLLASTQAAIPLLPLWRTEMKCGTMRSGWIAQHPTQRLDAPYWLLVIECVVENGVDPLHATQQEVRAAMTKVETNADKHLAQAQALSQEARCLQTKAAALRKQAAIVKGNKKI